MISKLFYANQVTNDEETFIDDRSLSRAIVNHFQKIYNVSSSMMLLQIKEETFKNNTRSLYNLVNASTILNMTINMIEREIMQFHEVFIIIFYRAQFKLYRQTLRNLSLMNSKLRDTQVRTMNFMQECQKSFIFLDLMICQNLDFMRLKNRVNVTCFRTKYVMMIVENIDQIMKKRIQLRRYFENVFNHVKLLRAFVTSIDRERNSYLSLSLSRADVIDQFIQSIANVEQSIVNVEIDNEKVSMKWFNEDNNVFEDWVISTEQIIWE